MDDLHSCITKQENKWKVKDKEKVEKGYIYQHEKQLWYTTAKQWYQNEKIRNSSQKGVEEVQ